MTLQLTAPAFIATDRATLTAPLASFTITTGFTGVVAPTSADFSNPSNSGLSQTLF